SYPADLPEPEIREPSAKKKAVTKAGRIIHTLTKDRESGLGLFLSDGTAYATVTVHGRRETLPVQSAEFKRWVAANHFQHTGEVVEGKAVADAVALIEANTHQRRTTNRVFRRIGRDGDTIFVDLCDPFGSVVKITADGWTVERNPAGV